MKNICPSCNTPVEVKIASEHKCNTCNSQLTRNLKPYFYYAGIILISLWSAMVIGYFYVWGFLIAPIGVLYGLIGVLFDKSSLWKTLSN